ncbi:diguanylate cyclase domain-containing protein [Candidatus Uabimicrobium amorphum]|uniref:GGDEF domain-containing protein n=1 Tax=Uabimicrobium amorphum TaxID=2596890 RepID=A0A5S9IS82_UABAM|nr:diguanylate cyclase [Candidatus Uabimicrobium amorphum]BBM86777.1 hypothetical protein UABAM_05165 [Candidatus Uabimicrobium amorphum]
MNQKHDTTKTIPTQKTQKQNFSQNLKKNTQNVFQRLESDPGSLQYNDIMQLQKMVGNDAVTRLLSGKQQSFSRRSINGFLQRNTPKAPIIQGVFKSESEIRKEQFVEEAKAKGITDPQQIDKLYAEARKDTPDEDPLTKFEVAADRKPTVVRAIEHVGNSITEKAFYVEIDVRNLGGLNEALGRSEGEKILITATQKAHKHINQLNSKGFVGSFRHGGDEFSFVVVGEVSLEEVEAKLTAAENEFAEINKTQVKGTTVGSIVHLKHKSQHGTAITWGVSTITGESDVGDVLSTADQIVELKKSFAALDTPQTQDPEPEQSSDQSQESQAPPKKKKRKMDKFDVDLTQKFYKRMIKSFSLQPKDVANGAILEHALNHYSTYDEGKVNAKNYIYKQIKAIGSLKYALRRKKDEMKSQEELKEAEFVKFAKEQGIEDDSIAKALFKSARKDIVDPVTGFQPKSSLSGTIESAITHVGAMGGEHRAVYVIAKLKNLAGLNHIMGANGTNNIFAEVATAAEMALRSELSQDGLHISDFREQGSKFSFVIVGRILTKGLVNAVLEKAAKSIADINKERIKVYNSSSEFAENTIGEKVIHPKKANQKGTGLAFGASNIEAEGDVSKVTATAQKWMTKRDV